MLQFKEFILHSILSWLDQLPAELIVIIISCFPIIELRGSLPVGMINYGMDFGKAYTLAVVGNMLPVLPLLYLFQPLSSFLRRYRWYARLYDWLYNRTMRKSAKVEKYGAIGLILFTAVPLPTTGAWSACVAASLFNIRISYAFLAILVGVLIAGVLVGGVSFIFG